MMIVPSIAGNTRLIIHNENDAAIIPKILVVKTDHKKIAISPRAKTDNAGGNGRLDCKKKIVITPKIEATISSVTPKKKMNKTYCVK